MREALRVGLGEARIGYVPAKTVIAALLGRWPQERELGEFVRLVEWAVGVAGTGGTKAIQLVSDRCPGTDSESTHSYKICQTSAIAVAALPISSRSDT